jgi:hypothetical protein
LTSYFEKPELGFQKKARLSRVIYQQNVIQKVQWGLRVEWGGLDEVGKKERKKKKT